MPKSDLAAEYWNELLRELKAEYYDTAEQIREEFLADGYPAFHEPRSPHEQLAILERMKQAGDPAFFEDPEAQSDYERLRNRLGGV